MKNKKLGSAIPMVLIFSFLLFTLGLAYSKMTRQSKVQTIQIDERIKLSFLAESMAELAMLKFQLYPADFYVCKELAEKNKPQYMTEFTTGASEFTMLDSSSTSSFNDQPVHVQLKSMNVLTENKYNKEVLRIEVFASYTDLFNRPIDKDVIRVVEVDRLTVVPAKNNNNP